MANLFEDDLIFDHLPQDNRCTPELLKEFVERSLKATGRYPTMGELRQRFGGLIGPIMDGHTLRDRGVWPEL
jgi:hypothetical protein